MPCWRGASFKTSWFPAVVPDVRDDGKPEARHAGLKGDRTFDLSPTQGEPVWLALKGFRTLAYVLGNIPFTIFTLFPAPGRRPGLNSPGRTRHCGRKNRRDTYASSPPSGCSGTPCGGLVRQPCACASAIFSCASPLRHVLLLFHAAIPPLKKNLQQGYRNVTGQHGEDSARG